MKRHADHALRCFLALTLAVALGGCGDDPVSPPDPGGNTGGGGSNAPSGPEILVVYPDGSIGWTSPPPDPAASTAGAVVPMPVSRKLVTAAEIDGTMGGRMQCGRFRLAVPAGAFNGKGTISMSMEDTTVMVVDVEITPSDLNNFDVPISLALDTSGADVDADTVSIYWWDPDNKTWVEMGCDKDLSDDPEVQDPILTTETRGLLTNLQHFSRYSGGKAGW